MPRPLQVPKTSLQIPTPPLLRKLFPGKSARFHSLFSFRFLQLLVFLSLTGTPLFTTKAYAFCGFYVAKADAKLFNDSSQVILVRDGDRTVLSMRNDYRGELKDFALVVPVPTVLKKEQIHIGEEALFDRIDSFTAPRLVEYYDPDPCQPPIAYMRKGAESVGVQSPSSASRSLALGVKIEAEYTIGEYDIVLLSATQSKGLVTWLQENGYVIPAESERALTPYIKQGLTFFVAKVNLENQAKTGFSYLRPIQMAFESPRFMLPIRLGTVNATGPQDLVMYMITRNGRVETTNYRTAKIPSEQEIPLFVRSKFGEFYQAVFSEALKKEGSPVVFTEYFWDMGWCDPCAADPLTNEELRKLGVFWINEDDNNRPTSPPALRGFPQPIPVKVTRLHARYDAKHWPDDLMFHETEDTNNFQARYILRHPYENRKESIERAPTKDACLQQWSEYNRSLTDRQENRAQTLASLTGWNIRDIRAQMNMQSSKTTKEEEKEDREGESSWWERLWD